MKKEIALEIGELPEIDIFEDTILSQRLLKKIGRPAILPHQVTTSAIRFQTNGYFKQALINQYLKVLFHLGISHKLINKVYEKDTPLNTDYRNKTN